MKWVRFDDGGTPRFGVLRGDAVTATTLTWPQVLAGETPDEGARHPLAGLTLLPPVETPGKIICIGLNYLDHCRETGLEPPKRPMVFSKFTSSMQSPGELIRWSPGLTQQVDYEAELAVVIGATAKHVAPQRALDYVFGYTAANDVSARDLQMGDGQWIRGKSLDTFCPLGPALVTADEIPDPQNLAIRCEVNGQVVQDSNTREMIFPVNEIVAFCSAAFTLYPGDLILTGTPHGVGFSRQPQLFLQHDDTVVVEIEGIGRLENRCSVL